MKNLLTYIFYFSKAFPESVRNAGLTGFLTKALLFLWLPFTNLIQMLVCLLVVIFINMLVGARAAVKNGEKFQPKKFFWGFMEHFIVDGLCLFLAWIFEVIVKINFPYEKFYILGVVTLFICLWELSCTLKNAAIGWPKYTYLQKLSGITNAWQDTIEEKAKNLPDQIINPKIKKDEV